MVGNVLKFERVIDSSISKHKGSRTRRTVNKLAKLKEACQLGLREQVSCRKLDVSYRCRPAKIAKGHDK
jgi:hypothetical protein